MNSRAVSVLTMWSKRVKSPKGTGAGQPSLQDTGTWRTPEFIGVSICLSMSFPRVLLGHRKSLGVKWHVCQKRLAYETAMCTASHRATPEKIPISRSENTNPSGSTLSQGPKGQTRQEAVWGRQDAKALSSLMPPWTATPSNLLREGPLSLLIVSHLQSIQ